MALRVHNLERAGSATLIDGRMECGEWGIVWDGRDEEGREISSGIYLYQLVVEEVWSKTMKMILLR